MTPYEALAHSFSTMPTGGFSTQPRSAEGFSAESQWILALFMLIAGANFALMYRAVIRRRPHLLARDEEFRLYIALAVVATAAVTAMLWGYGIAEGEAAVRRRPSRTVSIMSTTGMASADFALWPALLLLSLFALMFVGLRGLDRRLDQGRATPAARQDPSPRDRPNSQSGARDAYPAKRRTVDERTLRAVAAFILLYVGAWAVGRWSSQSKQPSPESGLLLWTRSQPLRRPSVTSARLSGSQGRRARSPTWGRLEGHADRSHVGRAPRDPPVVVLLTRHYWRL